MAKAGSGGLRGREWSTKEKLLLVSCVHKFGDGAWGPVSKYMERAAKEDPELSNEPGAYSQSTCAAEFSSLSGGEEGRGRRGSAANAISNDQKIKQVLSQLTLDRMGELESLIQDEEGELQRLEKDLQRIVQGDSLTEAELRLMLHQQKEKDALEPEAEEVILSSSDSEAEEEVKVCSPILSPPSIPPPPPSTKSSPAPPTQKPTQVKDATPRSSPRKRPQEEGGDEKSASVKRTSRRSKESSSREPSSTKEEPWHVDFGEERRKSGSDAEWKLWRTKALSAHAMVSEHRHANIFLNAVKEKDAPGYTACVRRPMDLKTLKSLIESGEESKNGKWLIRTNAAYVACLLTMFANAVVFNASDGDVPTLAREMEAEVIPNALEVLELQSSPDMETSTNSPPETSDATSSNVSKGKSRRSTRSSLPEARNPKRAADSPPGDVGNNPSNKGPAPKKAKKS